LVSQVLGYLASPFLWIGLVYHLIGFATKY